jgi:hypothetical protein
MNANEIISMLEDDMEKATIIADTQRALDALRDGEALTYMGLTDADTGAVEDAFATLTERLKRLKSERVTDEYGREFDLAVVLNLMDEDIREDLHMQGFETEQEFFDAYCKRHEELFGEEFEIN